MTTETTTAMTGRTLELGCIDKRDVITSDGRIVGQLTGAYIDMSMWTVNGLVVDVNKDVMDELNLKKPILKHPKARLPTSVVSVISDTVQLNVPLADLGGNLSVVD